MSACRNGACDNADGSKGICAPGDTSDYCIACDDARGGYSKPCPWPNETCPCKCSPSDADGEVKTGVLTFSGEGIPTIRHQFVPSKGGVKP